jgi:uncharacterized membrane protein
MLNGWLHLIALFTYAGSIVGLSAMLLPAVATIKSHEDKLTLLVRGLKLYNPLQVGSLGILVFTGAFQLTELKAAYRELFAKQLGYDLGMKLLFAFFLIIVSVWQSMGIGHRLVRTHDAGETISEQQLASVTRRLQSSTWLILALALVTAWFGLRLRF